MDSITLYSTNCPRCKVLEKKLEQKHINFIINNDIDYMQSQGWVQAPILVVNGEVKDFSSAIAWINQR